MIGERLTSAQLEGVSVHAGFPNPALDGSLDSLDLNRLLVIHPAGTYFMQIVGNDWADIGIFDDDLIIVDRVMAPRRIDLIIWWEGESFIIGHPMDVPKKTPIWGVVTTTIHRYRSKP